MPVINSGPAWLKASSKEEVLTRIKHERAVELIAEGHRWFDLRRWGIALEVLPGRCIRNNRTETGYSRVHRERFVVAHGE